MKRNDIKCHKKNKYLISVRPHFNSPIQFNSEKQIYNKRDDFFSFPLVNCPFFIVMFPCPCCHHLIMFMYRIFFFARVFNKVFAFNERNLCIAPWFLI